MSEAADKIETVAMILDDVEQSMTRAMRDHKYQDQWREEVPVDAWLHDIQHAIKLLVPNL